MKAKTSVKSKFPIFQKHPQLVYLDSAATTHKPKAVIDEMHKFYEEEYATVHRAIYTLSVQATEKVERARQKVADFIHAKSAEEIVFTKGATESINLVKHSLGSLFSEGDEILITESEHHANIVPWQLLAEEKNLTIKVAKVLDTGHIDEKHFFSLLSEKTVLVSFAHVFNATGVINPVERLIKKIREKNVYILLDGAQAVSHFPVDVQKLDADFYVFSFHKLYGPNGLGILYGKKEVLEKMPPFQAGGDMIDRVDFSKTTFQKPPLRFEAGTPPIVEMIGALKTLECLESFDLPSLWEEEKALAKILHQELKDLKDITLIGDGERIATALFYSEKLHPLDLGTLLDLESIAIRTGHHCAQPLLRRFSRESTCRASLGIYNTEEDIEKFLTSLKRLLEEF